MRYFIFILVFCAYSVRSDSYVIPIPDGMIAFWSFNPKTELEVKAFAAARIYLKEHNEDLNRYYLAENGLDVKSGLYRFYIKHSSTYRKNKNEIDESYKNGVIYYDVKTDKIVKFERK